MIASRKRVFVRPDVAFVIIVIIECRESCQGVWETRNNSIFAFICGLLAAKLNFICFPPPAVNQISPRGWWRKCAKITSPTDGSTARCLEVKKNVGERVDKRKLIIYRFMVGQCALCWAAVYQVCIRSR